MLTDLASLRREFFRLVDSDSTDEAMTEHDLTSNEGIDMLLGEGADDAQNFLLSCGLDSLWLTESSVLTFTGSDPNMLSLLPTDFLRLGGDEFNSALFRNDNVRTRWGRLINAQDRLRRRGAYYYVLGSPTSVGRYEIRLCPGAGAPSNLKAEYIRARAALVEATTVDFPVEYRPLIVAFAATRATTMPWYTGGQLEISLIDRLMTHEKKEAWRRSRTSRQPKQGTPSPMVGDHWLT